MSKKDGTPIIRDRNEVVQALLAVAVLVLLTVLVVLGVYHRSMMEACGCRASDVYSAGDRRVDAGHKRYPLP